MVCASNAVSIAQQVTRRSWIEFEGDKALNDRWELLLRIALYQTLFDDEWVVHKARLDAFYSIHSNIKLIGSFGYYYTHEKEQADIFELRPWQGAEIDFPRFKRGHILHLLRFEERFQLERGDWSGSLRGRYQGLVRYAINKPTLEKHALYIYAAQEWFNNFNQPLVERFSSRRRTIGGLGFFLDESKQVEFLYMAEIADNIRDDILSPSYHVFRLRFFWTISD